MSRTALATALLALSAGAASAQSWPQVFDPMQVLSLNLQLDPADWQTIQDDETFTIEVPAQFWADGEAPILVSIRRKSSSALQNGTPFKKVGYKIDINDFVAGQLWRSLNKLSLENGDDQDVVSEGIAWHLHRLASGPAGYDYEHPAAMAAWVRVTINGVYTGLYLSAEQRDRQFLRNRGLDTPGQTWLYEVEDAGRLETEVGTGNSPALTQLCYTPFEPGLGGACAAPAPAVMAQQMGDLIQMRSMLTLAAIDALCSNPDGIFSHGKNFFFADFGTGRQRMYFPWDLDSVLGGQNYQVYSTPTAYASVVLGMPQFRAQYSSIFNALICGPLTEANIHAFISTVEPILTPHLAADPNSKIQGSIPDFFAGRRARVTQRLNSVRAQIEGFVPCAALCYPNCDGSTQAPVLNVADFGCFLARYAAGEPYANCDQSTAAPVLNVADFGCFLTRYAAGCP